MRILAVEDEPRAAKRLVRLTHELLGSEVESLRVAASLEEGRALLAGAPIDLLLLDLNLRGEDGFTLLNSALAESFHTIVVSAHTGQALHAFEHGVLDFVPKPVEVARLGRAFGRLKGRREPANPPARFLAVKHYGKVELVAVDDIAYIQGADVYSEIHLRSGGTRLHDKTLDRLEVLLTGDFVRIHRSFIVCARDIAALRAASGTRYTVDLQQGASLPVGRTRVADLRSRLFLA